MSGNQKSLALLPAVKGNGKLEAVKEFFSAVKTFARSIEKAVIAVKHSFQTAGKSVGTVAEFLFDLINGESFRQGQDNLFNVAYGDIVL